MELIIDRAEDNQLPTYTQIMYTWKSSDLKVNANICDKLPNATGMNQAPPGLLFMKQK